MVKNRQMAEAGYVERRHADVNMEVIENSLDGTEC